MLPQLGRSIPEAWWRRSCFYSALKNHSGIQVMHCSYNKKLRQTETISQYKDLSTGQIYQIEFQSISNNFHNLVLNNLKNYMNTRQLDFVFLTQSHFSIVEDITSALQQVQSYKYQITLQLHVISPFKDLLGQGTSLRNLTQYNLNKQLVTTIKKQMQINTCLIVNIIEDQVVSCYRFFILDALQLSKQQTPQSRRIICMEFRRMQDNYINYLFKLYGEDVTEKRQEFLGSKHAQFQNQSMTQSIKLDYSQKRLDRSLNYCMNKIKEHQTQLYDSKLLEEVIHKEDLQQEPPKDNATAGQQYTSTQELANSVRKGHATYSLQLQLKTLQQKFDELRREKMVAESGRNQLTEENRQMKEEIAKFRESQKLQQLRIQKLERELQTARASQSSRSAQNVRQSEESDKCIRRLQDKLKASESRVEQLLQQGKQLREQMRLMAEQLSQ